jgi:hypothetical protein
MQMPFALSSKQLSKFSGEAKALWEHGAVVTGRYERMSAPACFADMAEATSALTGWL